MRVITVLNQKGGVGKSTVLMNLAVVPQKAGMDAHAAARMKFRSLELRTCKVRES